MVNQLLCIYGFFFLVFAARPVVFTRQEQQLQRLELGECLQLALGSFFIVVFFATMIMDLSRLFDINDEVVMVMMAIFLVIQLAQFVWAKDEINNEVKVTQPRLLYLIERFAHFRLIAAYVLICLASGSHVLSLGPLLAVIVFWALHLLWKGVPFVSQRA